MNEQTENLPILQDFVAYWGRCPIISLFYDKENREEETIAKRYHMVSITIAPLYTGFHL